MICPKCDKGEIKEQISIKGILFWKRKEVYSFCPLCEFENKKEFKLSARDMLIEDLERRNLETKTKQTHLTKREEIKTKND